ncbi:MAG: glycosyltransferase family 2 protein [Phycisphaeraceae bacterium]|nr:glycosyltransferase family 2 protein [Phycisphaerales bacterium]MCB9860125.1 glycosyltransferase family 2 protein [Phycisphaeraceae bacterium]
MSGSRHPAPIDTDLSEDTPDQPVQPLELAVRVVIPCFNRTNDLERLLFDLRNQKFASEIPVDLRILVVDNASSDPITLDESETEFRVGVLRLEENLGGSGGFNAGLAWWLENEPTAPSALRREVFYWLLDSDARLATDALHELLHTAVIAPEAVVVGSALAYPIDQSEHDQLTPMPKGAEVQSRIFELGGRVSRVTGEYMQPDPARDVKRGVPVAVEYVAACSMLVRHWGIQQAGLMPDVFLNGDDVEWCIRLARVSGGSILATPASVAFHPAPDRMRLLDRAYASRNAFTVLESLRLGSAVRRRRAVREICRSVTQTLIGRDDLASMHLAGLGMAAFGPRSGRAPDEFTQYERPQPMHTLVDAVADALRDIDDKPDPVVVHLDLDLPMDVRDAMVAALNERGVITSDVQPKPSLGLFLRRAFLGPDSDIAIISARSRAAGWLCAHTMFGVSTVGWNRTDIGRLNRLVRCAWVLVLGLLISIKLWIFGPRGRVHRPPSPARHGQRPTISTIVLSYNRPDALMHTVRAMQDELDFAQGDELHIVDNASDQATRDVLREIESWNEPGIHIQLLPRNLAIGGFNRGVRAAHGDLLFILDDDAIPAHGVLDKARKLLAERTELAAVTLLPVHPRTGQREWPAALRLNKPTDQWPFMGCGNLVRHAAWRRVGGYEKTFFLYRNDTDLALKLLALSCGPGATPGSGVYMNPHWTVIHNSKATRRKSSRWFETATRNWFWVCRRHGKGVWMYVALVFGWLWAHKLAGLYPKQHAHVQAGVQAGMRRPPPLPPGVDNSGMPIRRLLWVRFATLITQIPRKRDPAPKPHRHRKKRKKKSPDGDMRAKSGRKKRTSSSKAKSKRQGSGTPDSKKKLRAASAHADKSSSFRKPSKTRTDMGT